MYGYRVRVVGRIGVLAGETFSRTTGLTLCETTYTDVMAINHNKLRVDKVVLTKALFAFLAQVAKKHACHNRRDFADDDDDMKFYW